MSYFTNNSDHDNNCNRIYDDYNDNWSDKNLEINKWKRCVIKVMSTEITPNDNQCQQCSKSFASEEELTQHMNQEHVGNA